MPLTPEARDLLARTLLGESDKSQEGMVSVAHVIRNRLNSGAWGPDNRLGPVIKAPKQFSMWNTDDPKLRALAAGVNAIPTTDPRYQRAASIADSVIDGTIPDPTNGATHYHTPDVHPEWSAGATPVATIGGHYFYQLPLTASNTAGTAVTGPSSVGLASATPTGPTSGSPIPHSAGASTAEAVNHALASAKSMLGKNEVPNEAELQAYLHDGGQDLDPHKAAWCAAFVSASLQKAGLPVPTQVVKDSAYGAGAWAPNYQTYGSAVDPNNIQAGDILVANNGHHVGFAEGPVRQGINGPEVQMLAGNESDNSGRYQPGANRSQVGMVGERWVPLSEYSARRYTPAGDATAAAPASVNPDAPAAQAQPTAATTASPNGAFVVPGSNQNAGFVGPGSDKVSLVQGMTTGTSHNPQLTTAANWGGGGTPAAAPAQTQTQQQAPAVRPDLAQRVPLATTPLPPARPQDATRIDTSYGPQQPPANAWNQRPSGMTPSLASAPIPPERPLALPSMNADFGPPAKSSPPASLLSGLFGQTTPSDPATYPEAAPQAMPGSGVNGMTAMTPGAPSMGFPAMQDPFGQQVSQLPGSMMASAQALIKSLFG